MQVVIQKEVQFYDDQLTTADPTDLFAGASPESVQAYQLAQAVLHLARSQLLTAHGATAWRPN